MPDWSKSQYVYVARGEPGHKIGIAVSLKRRMGELRVRHKATVLVRSWHRPKDARWARNRRRRMVRCLGS